MATGQSVILGTNTTGQPIRIEVTATGDSDSSGNPLYALAVDSFGAQTVSPAGQDTTASFVDVAGSTLDTLNNSSLSYTILNSGSNAINWKVLAGNASDFSDAVTVKNSANVNASATDSYTAAPPPYRYYKVQVDDASGGSHGTAVVNGIAKG